MFVSCQHVLFFPLAKSGSTLSIFLYKIRHGAQKSYEHVQGIQISFSPWRPGRGAELKMRSNKDFVQVDKNMSVSYR